MNVAGKVFIITGASSGIGEQLAVVLAQKGAQIVCAARRADVLQRVTDSIVASAGSAIAVQTDITDLDACQNMVKQAVEVYGKVDGLILNAGVSMWAKFEDITDITFFKTLMDVNYHGAVNCCQSALPHLKKTNGKIVSCSTAQAIMGFPNHSGYVASKHALHGFLSTLDMEMKGQVSILEAVLSWIRGTNLRDNAFGADGKKLSKSSKKHTSESVSLEDCVNQIILAIEADKSTVYIPKKLGMIPFLNTFFQGFLRRKVSGAIDKNPS
ncbi:MAG: SDR family oxidoreductase [Candidatus Marinimicrobia bacterium]|nr:SDR family oxidoreductase [Candidatus Neomarinimicrobiota bacterium]